MRGHSKTRGPYKNESRRKNGGRGGTRGGDCGAQRAANGEPTSASGRARENAPDRAHVRPRDFSSSASFARGSTTSIHRMEKIDQRGGRQGGPITAQPIELERCKRHPRSQLAEMSRAAAMAGHRVRREKSAAERARFAPGPNDSKNDAFESARGRDSIGEFHGTHASDRQAEPTIVSSATSAAGMTRSRSTSAWVAFPPLARPPRSRVDFFSFSKEKRGRQKKHEF